LEEDVEKGIFRSDLFYRLNVITIRIPPLRERREDIPLISRHYLRHFSEKNQKRITGFESDVLPVLSMYDWPGNVRELENTIERAVILCPFEAINVESLSRKFMDLATRTRESIDEMTLPELEKKVIGQALEKAAWNQSKAAALLGISRKQLRTKMKNFDL
jgi:DNA-binding NtrC family response regulator